MTFHQKLSDLEKAAQTKPQGWLENILAHGKVNAGIVQFDEPNFRKLWGDKYVDEFLSKQSQRQRTTPPQIRATVLSGAGAQLKILLAHFGFIAGKHCSCNQRALLMNDRGVSWCNANRAAIIGWLKEEADKRHMPFNPMLAAELVNLAIRRAQFPSIIRPTDYLFSLSKPLFKKIFQKNT